MLTLMSVSCRMIFGKMWPVSCAPSLSNPPRAASSGAGIVVLVAASATGSDVLKAEGAAAKSAEAVLAGSLTTGAAAKPLGW